MQQAENAMKQILGQVEGAGNDPIPEKAHWPQFQFFDHTGCRTCRLDPKHDDRQITERVNELDVAKLLAEDPLLKERSNMSRTFCPTGAKSILYATAATTISISKSRLYGPESPTLKRLGINTFSARNIIQRRRSSLRKRNGWEVPFTAIPSPHALISWNTRTTSKLGSLRR